MLHGRKHPLWMVLLALSLLTYGCPIPAIVATFDLDERSAADWQRKAGQSAKSVQEQIVCQGQLDVGPVQADELYTKTQAGSV